VWKHMYIQVQIQVLDKVMYGLYEEGEQSGVA
jgi:hypothetical protein